MLSVELTPWDRHCTTPARRPELIVPRAMPAHVPPSVPRLALDASAESGGSWEWRACYADGADVCSMPFVSYDAAARAADEHARGALLTAGRRFVSIEVRRVMS